jgi:hypothetical protein
LATRGVFLYQAPGNKLKSVDIETGDVQTIPLDLKYTPDVPKGRIIVQPGTWWTETAKLPVPMWTS